MRHWNFVGCICYGKEIQSDTAVFQLGESGDIASRSDSWLGGFSAIDAACLAFWISACRNYAAACSSPSFHSGKRLDSYQTRGNETRKAFGNAENDLRPACSSPEPSDPQFPLCIRLHSHRWNCSVTAVSDRLRMSCDPLDLQVLPRLERSKLDPSHFAQIQRVI